MELPLSSARPNRRFRLGFGGALGVSLLFHLALLAWVNSANPAGWLLVPGPEAARLSGGNPPKERAPLSFTFVDVPDDVGVPENPRASLLSDKTREARQPVRTPPDAQDLGPDPHSEGNSKLRQLARAGPPPSPTPPAPAFLSRAGGGAPEPRGGVVGKAGEEIVPKGEGETETVEGRPRAGGREAGSGEGEGTTDRNEAFRKALEQLESGTYDFSSFDNPSYLQGSNYGTLSFDTKGFDWGDYARQIYLIVKKNWYDRIPIAAYYGQKGKVFLRFVIEKDGSITDLALIGSSDISPFDRAAENAIRASNPLPPLPSNFPKEREGVTFGFYYNLPIDH